MNKVKIIKAKGGRGYFLTIEDVIFQAPLTALELLTMGKIINDMREELRKELD